MQTESRTMLKKRWGQFAIWILIAVSAMALTSCESVFGPKTIEDREETDKQARIIVYNNYGEALDIYMDGKFQFTLDNDDDKKIRNVALDEHAMEAKLPGTSKVVDEQDVDVISYSDYTYTIDDPPDISITNRYGKTLRIYFNGVYVFDLLHTENRWLMNVDFAEHVLKAYLDDNGKNGREIASTTIDVDKNQDYTWLIQ